MGERGASFSLPGVAVEFDSSGGQAALEAEVFEVNKVDIDVREVFS
ncbi:hypothetical protein ACRAJ3_11635 [Rhodococcus pyridinivorans]